MKIKLPHSVAVGPKDYSVSYKPVVTYEGDTVCGFMNGPRYEIQISTTENKEEAEILNCLFHETLHAILYTTGQSDTLGDSKQEEGIVVALENFFAHAVDWKSDMWQEWKLVTLRGTQ